MEKLKEQHRKVSTVRALRQGLCGRVELPDEKKDLEETDHQRGCPEGLWNLSLKVFKTQLNKSTASKSFGLSWSA